MNNLIISFTLNKHQGQRLTKTSRDVEEPQQVPISSAGVEGKEEKKKETRGKVIELSLLLFSHSCCYYPLPPPTTCYFSRSEISVFLVFTTGGQQTPGK